MPKTNVDGREITLDYAESLLKGIASGKIKGNKFKREYNNIVDNIEAIVQKPLLTRSQEKTVEILFLSKEILKSKDKKTEEQPDTTDITELESEESSEQEKKTKKRRIKNTYTNQMLSRLPITLAQLKAGNNSEKLKNEIRQLLHSLYRSKKLTKQLYKSLIDII